MPSFEKQNGKENQVSKSDSDKDIQVSDDGVPGFAECLHIPNSASYSSIVEQINSSKLPQQSRDLLMILFNYFDDKFDEKERELVNLKGHVSALQVKIDKMESQLATASSLESRVEKLEADLDTASAQERRDTLVLSGNVPPASRSEDCSAIVRTIIRDHLNININSSDISSAYRLGPKPKIQGPDTRNIMFKLCRRDMKNDILRAFQGRKLPIYVNESVTPLRGSIMYHLRRARSRFPRIIDKVRVFSGNVVVYVFNQGAVEQANGSAHPTRRITINTRSALDRFLAVELSSSLRDMGLVWRD